MPLTLRIERGSEGQLHIVAEGFDDAVTPVSRIILRPEGHGVVIERDGRALRSARYERVLRRLDLQLQTGAAFCNADTERITDAVEDALARFQKGLLCR